MIIYCFNFSFIFTLLLQ